ncbi:MAG: AAA family ATPase [bacterium]|nr:AAA family ATPase [bacterium]
MKITKLDINNFRGFKKLSIKFPTSNSTVLVGVNGAGKTAILDCIAMFLSQFIARLVDKKTGTEFVITDDDINITSEETMNTISISMGNKLLDWTIGKSYSKKYKDIWLDASLESSIFPVLVYYQTNRIIQEITPKQRQAKYSHEQFSVYDNAFKKGISNFTDFLNWFRYEEDKENEIRLRENQEYRSKVLETVRQAMELSLNRFSPSDFSDLRVVRTGDDSSFVINKDKENLKIEQLSDGEKMILMVVCDLARRLAIANPGLENSLQGKGIVLIDEIDLHLHPQWQREVIPAFTKTFPNCQFIVTTHSPQVLSNVEKENIIMLDNWKIVENTPHTLGRDSNSILFELMNVEDRPKKSKEQLRKLYDLIENGKLEEAQQLLRELTEQFGDNDSEIVSANLHIDLAQNQ